MIGDCWSWACEVGWKWVAGFFAFACVSTVVCEAVAYLALSAYLLAEPYLPRCLRRPPGPAGEQPAADRVP